MVFTKFANTLRFTKRKQKMNFVVIVKESKMKPSTINNASLVWTDDVHRVRSPIVFCTRPDGKSASHFSRPHIVFMLIPLMIIHLFFSFLD
ncbi:putative subtilisin-like protease, fibronectin type-III domain-containing protein [Helianthus anomalus]